MGQIVKFVELVHDCILSKQQRNEMNRQHCDGRSALTGMNALTAQRFISVQSHEMGVRSDSLTF